LYLFPTLTKLDLRLSTNFSDTFQHNINENLLSTSLVATCVQTDTRHPVANIQVKV